MGNADLLSLFLFFPHFSYLSLFFFAVVAGLCLALFFYAFCILTLGNAPGYVSVGQEHFSPHRFLCGLTPLPNGWYKATHLSESVADAVRQSGSGR